MCVYLLPRYGFAIKEMKEVYYISATCVRISVREYTYAQIEQQQSQDHGLRMVKEG